MLVKHCAIQAKNILSQTTRVPMKENLCKKTRKAVCKREQKTLGKCQKNGLITDRLTHSLTHSLAKVQRLAATN